MLICTVGKANMTVTLAPTAKPEKLIPDPLVICKVKLLLTEIVLLL